MNKPANITYPIHDLLKNRWSPRAFSDRPVEPDKLRSLFEAARWSPSGGNTQPWSFILATRDDEKGFSKIVDTLTERNKLWAAEVPVLMITVLKRNRPDVDAPNPWAPYDLGQAAAHLSVQAEALGLRVHQMAGFDREKAREHFAIPETHEALTVIAIGYHGATERLAETFREREGDERTRKPLEEIVFQEEWGSAHQIVHRQEREPTIVGASAKASG
jgi:nitroreductase